MRAGLYGPIPARSMGELSRKREDLFGWWGGDWIEVWIGEMDRGFAEDWSAQAIGGRMARRMFGVGSAPQV
jgi:hypothetical protein